MNRSRRHRKIIKKFIINYYQRRERNAERLSAHSARQNNGQKGNIGNVGNVYASYNEINNKDFIHSIAAK